MQHTENICLNCDLKLIDKYFDKCMYCGEPIPHELRLSDKEKNELKKEKEERLDKYIALHQNENICLNCDLRLIDKYFDKCMYCGEPIPHELRLSDKEKNELKKEKGERLDKYIALHQKHTKAHRKYMEKYWGGKPFGGTWNGVDFDITNTGDGA